MSRDTLSTDSLAAATRDRSRFSGHGNAKGAAGYRAGDETIGTFLRSAGDVAIINPTDHAYGEMRIGAAWDNVKAGKQGFLGRVLKKAPVRGVDLDLGCLYELANGERGVVQAFGNHYGHYDELPGIALSGDERTGNAAGDDEFIRVNGVRWPEIRRILVYVYIYDGAPHWAEVRPRIRIDVPGEQPMIAVPGVHKSELAVCAIAGLENVRNGIKMINYTEYFPGHSEMDRAFGYGIQWTDGKK